MAESLLDHYRRLLGLQTPWEVSDVKLARAGIFEPQISTDQDYMLVRSVQTETRRSLLYPACVAVGTSGLGRLEPDLRACRRWPESVDVAQVTENDAVRRDRALEVARSERRIRSRDDREHLIVCCMIGSPGLIAAAGVVQEEAGKWRAPVFYYTNQTAFLYQFCDLFLEGQPGSNRKGNPRKPTHPVACSLAPRNSESADRSKSALDDLSVPCSPSNPIPSKLLVKRI